VLLDAADTRVDFVLPARLTALDIDVVFHTAGTETENQRVKDAFDLLPHSAAVLLVSGPEAD
jgi:hypothetical protein